MPQKQGKDKIQSPSYLQSVWSSYASIPNSYNKHAIHQIKKKHNHLTREDVIWCATEKVHGANFSMMTDGHDVLAASRNFILDDSSNFFNGWQNVRAAMRKKVLKAFKLLNQKYCQKINAIVIYGELFGGLYNHHIERYTSLKDQKAIQTGIHYCPGLKFYAFDIKTDLYDHHRLSVEEAIHIFEECGFLYAKILKMGTFDDMMKFNVDNLQSTIPKSLDLPPPTDSKTQKKLDNIAEGVVIRPFRGNEHVLLKIKSQKFLEITNCCSKWSNQRKNGLNKLSQGTHGIKKELLGLIARCVNKQRLQSVESKIGRLNNENKHEIQHALLIDVLAEMEQIEAQKKFIDGMEMEQKNEICAFITALTDRLLDEELEDGIGRHSNKVKKRTRKRQRSRRGSKNRHSKGTACKVAKINQEIANIKLHHDENKEIVKEEIELSTAEKTKMRKSKKRRSLEASITKALVNSM